MFINNHLLRSGKLCVQQNGAPRTLSPDEISVPPGYEVEIFAQGLETPVGIVFTNDGDLLYAESGYTTGNPRVIRISNGQFDVIAEGFPVPITGINIINEDIYVSSRGVISVVKLDGSRRDIIRGLPAFGDYANNRVTFGPDGKIYFGLGTYTNSGVVGLDNDWIFERPDLHDNPGAYILVHGINYETEDVFIPAQGRTLTGAFKPFGVPNSRNIEVVDSRLKASGSILRANPDGSDLELVAWGLRNPVQLNSDGFNQLYLTNQGYENRGSRPIANALDEIYILNPGAWYGWPDYTAGLPVNQPRFTPEGGEMPAKLLAGIPSVPPRPVAVFPSEAHIMGFDFNMNPSFGVVGEAYVAEFGYIRYRTSGELVRSGYGHRISKVDVNYGEVTNFAINKTGFPAYSPYEGGLGRPTDVRFGPDGAMYISDFTSTILQNPNHYQPNTGVIWRIIRL
jgi:glucose/arabinose dehydrogenase